jgi:hypothetical protein
MRPNPQSADHPEGSPSRRAQQEFDRTYRDLLRTLEAAFDGRPELLADAVRAVYRLRGQAEAPLTLPDGAAEPSTIGLRAVTASSDGGR